MIALQPWTLSKAVCFAPFPPSPAKKILRERNLAKITELCIISRDTENVAMSTAFERGVCCYLARSWAACIVEATFRIAWGYRPFKQQFGGPDLAPPGVVYSKGSVLVSNARSFALNKQCMHGQGCLADTGMHSAHSPMPWHT